MDIQQLIRIEMESRGIRNYKVEPVFIDIVNPYTIISLNKYIYLFVSEKLDAKIHTVVNITSPDNAFRFNKSILEGMTMPQRFFSEELIIKIENYGLSFVPIRLEFLKIIPELEKEVSK